MQVRFQTAGEPEIRAHTKNIGVGGAFIITPKPPAIGTHLRLTIEIPSGPSSIEIRAEVRWIVAAGDDGGMGVRFSGLDVDQLLQLNEYFASLTATEEHG